MKKVICKLLGGAILLAICVLMGGLIYLNVRKQNFRQELEEMIDNNHLEGQDAIGAFYYQTVGSTATVHKVSDFDYDYLSWMSIRRTIMWGGQCMDYTDVVLQMLQGGNYKWYEFESTPTTINPFMIIVRKTNKGYDITGEFILGIGLTKYYPNNRIFERVFEFPKMKLSDGTEITAKKNSIYEIKPDMLNSYFEYLLREKYHNITVRNEITRDNWQIEKNEKLDMLNNLVMKLACQAGSSLYFRVNRYFELKPNDDYFEMGSSPIIYETSSFGNMMYTVFTRTVTMRYSIQENTGVLEKECKRTMIIMLLILEAIYILLGVIFIRSSNYRIKSY